MQDKQFYKIEVKKPFTFEEKSKVWNQSDDVGLPISRNTLLIALMAGKDIVFTLKRRKYSYRINPSKALYFSELLGSFFTSKMGELFAVVPKSVCEEVIL